MTAPAIVFTYNRKEQTRKTLEALDANTIAKDTELFIFCDGYRENKPGDKEKVQQVHEYLQEFAENNHFRKVTLNFAPKNNGLARSVIAGVTSVIEQYGTVIVTEDDLVSHKNYLEYMNEGLEYYRNNAKVWSISGYSYPLKSLNDREEVYFTYRGSSWGWATWKDRWDTVDWDVRDYKTLLFNPKRMKNLNDSGRDLFVMLRDQRRGVIDSWAVRWVFEQTRNHLVTVYPPKTFVYNIGFDGSGTHTGDDGNDTYDSLDEIRYRLTIPKYEPEILTEFAQYYEDPYLHIKQKYKPGREL